MIPMIELEASALPIFISNSNNEHSDDLAYTTPQLVGEVEISHSFREANDSNASSGETNMVRFRTLGQNKTALATDPPIIAAPPINQVLLPTVDLILVLADAVMGIRPSSSEALLLDKHKGRSSGGPFQKVQEEGGRNELGLHPFFGCEC